VIAVDPEQFTTLTRDVLAGTVRPEAVSLPAPSDASPWLDEIERRVFVDAERGAADDERLTIDCERAGFRAARQFAGDDCRAVAWWLFKTIEVPAANGRLRALLAHFSEYRQAIPSQQSGEVH
jgi:hypothetical protein